MYVHVCVYTYICIYEEAQGSGCHCSLAAHPPDAVAK